CCARWRNAEVDALHSRPVVEPRSTFASRNRPSFGAWCVIPGAFTAQLMAYAGFDWLCIDMQHGMTGYTELRSMVQAVRPTGVAGLDGIYVGPNDLGLSLGLPPMLIDHGPLLTEAITQIADACRRHGVVAGIAVYEPDAPAAVEKWRGVGYTLFGLPSDSLLL